MRAAAGGPPWDYANNCGREGWRGAAWAAHDWLTKHSSAQRLHNCRRVLAYGHDAVELRYRAHDQRANYAGYQTCGSVWICPLCGPKILAGRADEIGEAVERWYFDGGIVAMVTLTMRHRRGQPLADLWDALGKAWIAARGNRRARRAMKSVEGWVRRVEVTEGENGWHVHVHALLFLPGSTSRADVDQVAGVMFDGWSSRLAGLGLDRPSAEHGVDVKVLDLTSAREDIARYLAKGTFEAMKPARRAALEITGGAKRARRGNRSSMQLLSDVATYGLAGDAALWWEFEAASHGKRSITWAPGFRDRLALSEERTDEELAAETDHDGELVATFPIETWRAIKSCPGAAARLLSLAEEAGAGAIALPVITRWLEWRGLPPPDPPPE